MSKATLARIQQELKELLAKPDTSTSPSPPPSSTHTSHPNLTLTDSPSDGINGGGDIVDTVSVVSETSAISPPTVLACCACKESCPEMLVYCLDCDTCFCRCRDAEAGGSMSHWAFHRRRAKHGHVRLFSSDGQPWALRCRYCHESVVSQLGFYSPAVWDDKDQTTLACRVCATTTKVQRHHANQRWTELLHRDTGDFQSEFLGGAPEHACGRPDKLKPTQQDLERLEVDAALRATKEAIAAAESAATLPPIPSTFADASEMLNAFLPVMEAEAEAQKEAEGSNMIPSCPGLVRAAPCGFVVELTMVTAGTLTKLSEVLLEFEDVKDERGFSIVWEGYVKSVALAIPEGMETCYRCQVVVTRTMGALRVLGGHHLFSVANKFGGVSLERMKNVLKRLTKDTAMSPGLHTLLLNGKTAEEGGMTEQGADKETGADDQTRAGGKQGTGDEMRPGVNLSDIVRKKSDGVTTHCVTQVSAGVKKKKGADSGAVDRSFPDVPGFAKLNKFQKQAALHAVDHPLTLIQGPPGTGKTSTCVVIVNLLQRLYGKKILVCAGSNTAVDHLASHLIKLKSSGELKGVNLVRVEAYSIQGNCSPEVLPYSLYQLTNNIIERQPLTSILRSLHERYQQGDSLWESVRARYEILRREVEQRVLQNASIVLSTCVTAGNRLFMDSGLQFAQVLMDEACQILEPESWIPLQHGAERLVLVGDQCQLDPMVRLHKAKYANLNRSLFERLLSNNTTASLMLREQYRMHPAIASFPSTHFYDAKLLNGVKAAQRTPKAQPFPWPNVKVPIAFLHVRKTPDESGPLGLSFRNTAEASIVVDVVLQLLGNGEEPEAIGIISPYKAQCEYISSRIARHPRLGLHIANTVEVSSVDKFQGREKKYIIHSCVRCNDTNDIGFMYDPRRLNVSLTRAQYGLILVGDVSTLWRATAYERKTNEPRSHTSRRVPTIWQSLIRHFADTNTLVRYVPGSSPVPYRPSFIHGEQQ